MTARLSVIAVVTLISALWPIAVGGAQSHEQPASPPHAGGKPESGAAATPARGSGGKPVTEGTTASPPAASAPPASGAAAKGATPDASGKPPTAAIPGKTTAAATPGKPEAHESAAKPAAPAAPAAAPKKDPRADLKAALERIDKQIKETFQSPQNSKATPARPPSRPASRPPSRPPSDAQGADIAAAAGPRIHLRWRVALSWPGDLDSPVVASADDRVSLSWR